ncbi:hypothetical protein AYI68_g138 [Smittium mucronatum]|uniref:DUF3752 domain-containing protein n=1 Tax=Smittium mucronatum TaxID=133383 RepID=A0A1R0H978_9FUNG|nr:hypothetical protein AYI68_g138 [Smittium mucronatum]
MSDYSSDEYAPDLPPSMKPRVAGPHLTTIVKSETRPVIATSATPENPTISIPIVGPKLPHNISSSKSDSVVVGPSIESSIYTQKDAQDQVASLINDRVNASDFSKRPDSEVTREKRGEWMTLPPSFSLTSSTANSGKPRKFELSNKPDQKLKFDESWTRLPGEKSLNSEEKVKDTPNKQKQDPSNSRAYKERLEQDSKKRKIVDSYNTDFRPKSLMEMHQEKLANSKNKNIKRRSNRKDTSDDDGSSEWKQSRFNKERDMSVKWVDTTRNNNLANQTGFLNDKYSHGSKGSFL